MSVPIARAFVGHSGATLTVAFGKLPDAPTVTARPGLPSVKINGTPATVAADPAWSLPSAEGEATPWVLYRFSPAAQAGDVVTYSLAADTITTTGGGNAAVTDATAENLTGQYLFPDTPPTDRRMVIGENVHPGNYYSPTPSYANRCLGGYGWNGWNLAQTKWDSDGYPASDSGSESVSVQLTRPDSASAAPLLGTYPLATAGAWRVLWDGACDALGVSHLKDDNAPQSPASQTITGGVGNLQAYDLTPSAGTTSNGLKVEFAVNPSAGQTLTRLKAYDPYVTDVNSPGYFHPRFLRQLSHARGLRSMAWLGTNASPVVDVTDWMPKTALSYNQLTSADTRVVVTRLDPYRTGTYNRGDGNYYKITTATPHGLKHGEVVTVYSQQSPGSWFPKTTVNLSDGTTVQIQLSGLVFVLDATTFMLLQWADPRPGTTVVTDGSFLIKTRWSCAYDDVATLAATLSQTQTLDYYWHNVPHAADDASITAQADMVWSTLPDTCEVVLEYSNEQAWNNAAGYYQYNYIQVMASEPGPFGGDPQAFVCCRAAQAYEIFRARGVALGKDVGRLKLAMSCRPDTEPAGAITAYCATHDRNGADTTAPGYSGPGPISYDYLAVSPYHTTLPITSESMPAEAHAAFTLEQWVDLLETRLLYFYDAGLLRLVAQMATRNPGVGLVAYEGGLTILAGPQGYVAAQGIASTAVKLHPRFLRCKLKFLSWYDPYLKYFTKYLSHEGVARQGNYYRDYFTYLAIDQEPGDGTGNVARMADVNGVPRAFALDSLTSPTAEAIARWNAPRTPPVSHATAPCRPRSIPRSARR